MLPVEAVDQDDAVKTGDHIIAATVTVVENPLPVNIIDQRIAIVRRSRPYPLRVTPSSQNFNNVLIHLIFWPDYYKLYTWRRMSFENACQIYDIDINTREFKWYKRSAKVYAGEALVKPVLFVIYYRDSKWTELYQNGLRCEERLRRLRFYYK